MSRYGQEYFDSGASVGQTDGSSTTVILDPIAYSSRLSEALQLLAKEFSEGRTPIADESAEQQKVDALLDDLGSASSSN